MAWCLTRSEEAKFRNALLEGKIDPFKIVELSSEERRGIFEKFVDPENARYINTLFESKLLLKNYQKGFKSWAEKALGISPVVKRDLISRIENMQVKDILDPDSIKNFKEDLVRSRLGFGVTFEEAKTINSLSKDAKTAAEKWNSETNSWSSEEDRISYGLKQVALENYVNGVKLEARNKKTSFKDSPKEAALEYLREAPKFLNDLSKSLMATLDNSFFGRQGIKSLFGSTEQKKIWAKTLSSSFYNIKAELSAKGINGVEPMDLVRADIYSRPNSMNGKYRAGGYELGVLTEEAFPTSLPERIPGIGRLFKASETAFNGSALSMRADLADLYIAKAEAQGLNMLNKEEAKGLGSLIGSMTGRGQLGRASAISKELNMLLWSARFFKSNIDTLTAHQFDPKATEFTKTQARQNLLSIVGHVGGLMLLAGLLDKDSVDPDPRSTNFGKIKVFGKWVDITGGMGSVVKMVANLIPTYRNGEFGVWKKSSSGRWSNLTSGENGAQDAVDVFLNAVFLNKLAPMASLMRDYYRGEMFGGKPFDIKESIVNSSVPLTLQSIKDVKDESFSTILAVVVSEFFGLSTYSYKYETDWLSKDTNEMNSFIEQVGEDKVKSANEDFNRAYNVWFEEVQKDPKYKSLSEDGKYKLQQEAKDALKVKIMREYGYLKIKKIKTIEERREEISRKGLVP